MSELQSEVADNDRVVFSVTVTYKYETTGAKLEEYYHTRDLYEAADIDRKNLSDDPQYIADNLSTGHNEYKVRVSAARFTGAK